MGAARDLFRQVGWAVHGKPDGYETLCRAAELWRAEGQPFRDGPRGVGCFLGRAHRRFQPQRIDFRQHGLAPRFDLPGFVGGVVLAVQ